mmetsp:Transcript_30495/g.97290  ORF Transcript_30495/g.97290 Transcript_30495/m.97290 type:complete len:111 (+) Transcript_30495:138-470(+)
MMRVSYNFDDAAACPVASNVASPEHASRIGWDHEGGAGEDAAASTHAMVPQRPRLENRSSVIVVDGTVAAMARRAAAERRGGVHGGDRNGVATTASIVRAKEGSAFLCVQ